MIELHPGTADQIITYNVLYSDLARTWWKMIHFHPGTADQNITLILFKVTFRLDIVKDDLTPPWYCRPESQLNFFLISDLAGTW